MEVFDASNSLGLSFSSFQYCLHFQFLSDENIALYLNSWQSYCCCWFAFMCCHFLDYLGNWYQKLKQWNEMDRYMFVSKFRLKVFKKLRINLKIFLVFSKLQAVLNCSWNSMWSFLAFSSHSFYKKNSSLFSDLISLVLSLFYLAPKFHWFYKHSINKSLRGVLLFGPYLNKLQGWKLFKQTCDIHWTYYSHFKLS